MVYGFGPLGGASQYKTLLSTPLPRIQSYIDMKRQAYVARCGEIHVDIHFFNLATCLRLIRKSLPIL